MTSFHRVFVIGSIAALAMLTATRAYAGDCPTCATAADCGGDFCVSWNTSPGCGTLLDICCPGQGCLVEDGCPSCFTQGNCSILDGPDTCRQATTSNGAGGGGGGEPTGGAAPNGSGGNAGTGGTGDGGTAAAGGSSSDGSGSDDGCGCSLVGSGGTPAAGAGVLFALAALMGRFARQARRDARVRSR